MAIEHAFINNTVTGDTVPVMFNPEEYTLNRDNNFANVAIPGLRGPLTQFVNGNMRTLDMELLIDTYEAHPPYNQAGDDVRTLTDKIVGLMDIDPSTHAPPVVMFIWGSLVFKCVLARVQQRFIMFKPDGIPVRARLQVTFNEYLNTELEAKETKRETADYTHLHTVSEGESLSSIAGSVLGNPQLWRAIAINNQIDNPFVLPVGTQLLIPQLPYRDPETGEVIA